MSVIEAALARRPSGRSERRPAARRALLARYRPVIRTVGWTLVLVAGLVLYAASWLMMYPPGEWSAP
jgi:hypothetical protein